MPFWLMMTNVLPFSGVHTRRLSSMTLRTLSSVNWRSASTMRSRSSAVVYSMPEVTSLACVCVRG